jgi:hypothetical protein
MYTILPEFQNRALQFNEAGQGYAEDILQLVTFLLLLPRK